jgi:magnesium chelatase family protein
LGRILPENSAKYVLGAANFRRIHGESSLRRHSVLLFSGRRAGAASRLHPAEELLLADQGVILVEDLLKTDLKTAGALFSWMDSGRVEWSRAGYAFAEELEAVAVAEVPPCECGSGGIGRCSCRPLELQNYRRRLERAVAGPFDLRCKLPAGERRPVPLAPARERIAEARERMRSRRGHLNGRLSVEALGMAAWPEKARLLLRSLTQESGSDARRQLAMARVAQTVCDLRGGEAVEEGDLLEAKHYSLLG